MRHNKILRHIFKFHGLTESLGFAFKGIIYLFLFHRNMRLIFICGISAVIMGGLLQLKDIELVILCITVVLVFMAEIFNTAIEMFMNMISVKYRIRIKLVKDIAAAVVLIACVNAVVVGYILFRDKLMING
ncbi:MAG: diacylglycerol kinase family protein [Candidatus Omnitrophica bacterium]|nr:diacylglycerol kinase family protein [Candidatus Omnitrophota bacterium]